MHGLLAEPDGDRFIPMDGDLWGRINGIVSRYGEFKERRGADNVEEDRSYKQIIPYACVVDGDMVLMYRRGGESSEERLMGNLSVGIGGHIDRGEGIMDALYREFVEEAMLVDSGTGAEVPFAVGSDPDLLKFVRMMDPQPIGLIDSNSSDVNRVHLGVAMMMTVPAGCSVAMRSAEDVGFEYVGVDDYLARKGRGEISLESWSEMVMGRIAQR